MSDSGIPGVIITPNDPAPAGPLDGYKTHITAVVAMFAGVATMLGWITPEDQVTINDASTVLLERVAGVALSLGGLISIFQRLATAKAQKTAQRALNAAVIAPAKTADILERK